jgi:hypothetical protein
MAKRRLGELISAFLNMTEQLCTATITGEQTMSLEFDEQLSHLQKPAREDMTDEQYAVFDKNVETMEKNWGFINNLFKILPLNASQYIGFLDFKASLFTHDTCWLSNADKEMIGLVVSSTNGCT